MSNSLKIKSLLIKATLVKLILLGSINVFAVCFPKAPAKYSPYYPIQIKKTNGAIFNGFILPTTTTVEIRDANKVLMAKLPINSLISTSGTGTCSTSYNTYAQFKTQILGDDGKTQIKIERFVGNELYKITVLWKGVNYYRIN